jgi:hypothetical protein
LAVPLSVDVTAGDKITPREFDYSFSILFDDRMINIMAYNLETIVSRGIANTRPRDQRSEKAKYFLTLNLLSYIIMS